MLLFLHKSHSAVFYSIITSLKLTFFFLFFSHLRSLEGSFTNSWLPFFRIPYQDLLIERELTPVVFFQNLILGLLLPLSYAIVFPLTPWSVETSKSFHILSPFVVAFQEQFQKRGTWLKTPFFQWLCLVRMKDCGEDMLVDMSEILFNELAFFRLMQDLDGWEFP